MSQKEKDNKQRPSTLAALLKGKPKRGRPPRNVSRQNVYVSLSSDQKDLMLALAAVLPAGVARADVPDLAITVLAARLEALRRAVADRDREIPEGVTDLESLFLLWDLTLPPANDAQKWTSIRVSPQQAIELGRVQGILNAVFGTNRSETFGLGLALLAQVLEDHPITEKAASLEEVRRQIQSIYL